MNETHLIDGAMGRPHVNALDIRMHNASLFGDGVYITEGLDGLPVTVVDANTVSVGRGVMLINGARITQEEKIDLTIESGSQGMNRNDLLVATYTYDAANTRCEDVNLEIVTHQPQAPQPIQRFTLARSWTSTTPTLSKACQRCRSLSRASRSPAQPLEHRRFSRRSSARFRISGIPYPRQRRSTSALRV